MSSHSNIPTRKYRVGVIGAGWVCRSRHVPSILMIDGVESIDILDRDETRARSLSHEIVSKSKGKVQSRSYSDRSEFLSEEFDVVHVATSPWSHCENTVAALESGANVFLEKPMAMNEVEASSMMASAAARGKILCVSHNFLRSSAMTKLKKDLRNLDVDYVLGLQMSAPSRRLPTWHSELPGGLLFDEIPHMLYTTHSLLGGDIEFENVRARWTGESCPSSADVWLKGRTGAGQITMNFNAPVSEWHVLASTPTKCVGLDLFRDIAIQIGPDGVHESKDIAKTSFTGIYGHVMGFARAGSRWVSRKQFWGHDVLIKEFYDAVGNGGDSPVALGDALQIVRLTDKILEGIGAR